MAWSAITSNKMRSFLTMLGIIIGVMSLVVLVSIANSATTSVTDEISNIGTNLLTVRIVDNKENPLKLSELSGFTDNDEIALAAPVAQSSVTAKADIPAVQLPHTAQPVRIWIYREGTGIWTFLKNSRYR